VLLLIDWSTVEYEHSTQYCTCTVLCVIVLYRTWTQQLCGSLWAIQFECDQLKNYSTVISCRRMDIFEYCNDCHNYSQLFIIHPTHSLLTSITRWGLFSVGNQPQIISHTAIDYPSFTMVFPSLTTCPSRPSSSVAALKHATKDSLRHLVDSTRSFDLETSTKDEHWQYQQLSSCIQAHKLRELSNEKLFQVKRHVPRKRRIAENAGKICIACTRPECFHKIFILETGLEDTPQGWLLEETRIMDELQQHETKHYMTFAKIFLWLLEAFMAMTVNYYKV
jgi:hypothetical protein